MIIKRQKEFASIRGFKKAIDTAGRKAIELGKKNPSIPVKNILQRTEGMGSVQKAVKGIGDLERKHSLGKLPKAIVKKGESLGKKIDAVDEKVMTALKNR